MVGFITPKFFAFKEENLFLDVLTLPIFFNKEGIV